MKRVWKWTKSVLAIGISASVVLAGCSSESNKENSPAQGASTASAAVSDTGLKPYALTFVFPTTADAKDMGLVEEAVNKITKEKINATVKFVPISFGAWAQQTTLMLSGNEKVDVIFSGIGTYNQQASKGQLLPMEDLIARYGQDAKAALDDQSPQILEAARIDGHIYGIPDIKDLAENYGFTIRKDLVDKYGIDLSAVKTIDDLDPVFQKLKDNEPTMFPTYKYALSIIDTISNGYMDNLGDGFGVLPNFDNNLKVVDWYETPEYAKLLDTVRRWYLAGFIPKDIATSTETGTQVMKAGKAASYLSHMKPGFAEQESRNSGQTLESIELLPAAATTGKITRFLLSIANSSGNPERAMMFINLLYTDKELSNLLAWGIEGKHYVKQADGTINYPAGVDATNTGYGLFTGYLFGNQFLQYVWSGNDPQLWTTMSDFNKAARKSKALGFSFNAEPVKTELAAVTNVTNQFKVSLETGTIDPKKNLPEFINQLKAAGIDKIVAEKQKQLDAWSAQQ
ncbi:ABC transporter substrate-binding protein [Paenibacillus sp. MMO-58]|uniref:ABC transporter substrate-binding protein n=1 Tax=Paenibacillus sp. MMO-58 TaxID=3081290 RepID=UPI0030176951